MGVHILYDPDYYSPAQRGGAAVFWCSTTGFAFGPVMEASSFEKLPHGPYFDSKEVAFAFLLFLDPRDPREVAADDLMTRWNDFVRMGVRACEECNGCIPAALTFCSPKCRDDRTAYLRDQAEDISGFANV